MMKTKKTNMNLACMFTACCLTWAGCTGGDSFREPIDAIDGYSMQARSNEWILINFDGTEAFEGKMVTDDDGDTFDGKLISFKNRVHPSVNGFYRIEDNKTGVILLSKELGKDQKPIILGPYHHVGMFYEDITPSVKKGESIKYINRKGEVVFDINERTGMNVRYAHNFMGGLSVIGISTENGVPLYGAINPQGELVLGPNYFTLEYFGSGLYYGIDLNKQSDSDDDNWVVDILDNTGKIMFSFKKKDYYIGQNNGNSAPFYFTFKDGYGILSDYNGYKWTIVNREGKELLKSDGTKALDKECRCGKMFAFYDVESRNKGVMNIKGEVIVPAEYSNIIWMDEDKFCGRKKEKYQVSNYDGEILFSSDSYSPIAPFKGGYSYIWSGRGSQCEFINEKGEVLTSKRRYGEINTFDWQLLDAIYSTKR